MTEGEVGAYLDKKNITGDLKSEVFRLLGGRPVDLFTFTNQLGRGVSFQGTFQFRFQS
jgi:hypothetical protein